MGIFKKAQNKEAIENFLTKEEAKKALRRVVEYQPKTKPKENAKKAKYGWMACITYFIIYFDQIAKEDVNQIAHHMLNVLGMITHGVPSPEYERGYRNAMYAIKKIITYIIERKKKEMAPEQGLEPWRKNFGDSSAQPTLSGV
jgi:hypothetical protein